MNAPRRHALLATWAVAILISGCAQKSVRTDLPAQVQVVLLPDPDTGVVGRVVVSNQAGQTELATAYASTRITTTRAPQIKRLKENGVLKQFGNAWSQPPPPPVRLTALYRSESQ